MKTSVVTWRKIHPLSHTFSLFLSFLLHCFVSYRCSLLIWFGPPKASHPPWLITFSWRWQRCLPFWKNVYCPCPSLSPITQVRFYHLLLLDDLNVSFSSPSHFWQGQWHWERWAAEVNLLSWESERETAKAVGPGKKSLMISFGVSIWNIFSLSVTLIRKKVQ